MKWIPQKELQGITGLSRQTLAEWANRPGCPKKVEGGKTLYAWPDWNEWRFQEGRKSSVPEDLEEARARKTSAEARLAELELARLEGRMLTVEDATREVEAYLNRLRSVLLAFTSRHAHRLVGKKSIPEVSSALDDAVHELMAALVEAGTTMEDAA